MVAIFLAEPERDDFLRCLAAERAPRIPAPNWVEVSIVLQSRGDEQIHDAAKLFVENGHLVVAPFLLAHARAAQDAWRRYGRGRHPARLNFGDCMAYGFARVESERLLFKGDDFSRTDIEPALNA